MSHIIGPFGHAVRMWYPRALLPSPPGLYGWSSRESAKSPPTQTTSVGLQRLHRFLFHVAPSFWGSSQVCANCTEPQTSKLLSLLVTAGIALQPKRFVYVMLPKLELRGLAIRAPTGISVEMLTTSRLWGHTSTGPYHNPFRADQFSVLVHAPAEPSQTLKGLQHQCWGRGTFQCRHRRPPLHPFVSVSTQ